MIGWFVYTGLILAVSGLIGMHLGRFREAYTEMTGMMAGMTMGMLNGFVLGFAAASATNSMFWGNLFGILLGLSLGVYFGRPGGLMGVMDGGMGGVMGGSMGAMLAVMLVFPQSALFWTAMLLTIVYVAGMVGLVALIEQSAPGHAALHRLAPFFARAVAQEVDEVTNQAQRRSSVAAGVEPLPTRRPVQTRSEGERGRRLVDYYALLGVPRNATRDEVSQAYLAKMGEVEMSSGDPSAARAAERLERGLQVLTDVRKRATYDERLAESHSSIHEATPGSILQEEGLDSHPANDRPDCCPPPRQKKMTAGIPAVSVHVSSPQVTQIAQVAVAGNQASTQASPQHSTQRARGASKVSKRK